MSELPWAEIGVGAAIFIAVGALFYTQVDLRALHDWVVRLPAAWVCVLLAVLPLVGFPASALHVATGMRFGTLLGLPIVVLSIAVHLVVSYALVRRWRDRFERARWLARLRKRLPRGAHGSLCVLTVLLPGAPYTAVNYALPLLGVRLRTLLLYALPVHALRSTVTVVFGDQIDKLSGARLAVLLAYALAVLTASWWTYRRLQSRFGDQPPAADGQRQPA